MVQMQLGSDVGQRARRRFAPVQIFAALCCSILTLMTLAAGLNGLFGHVPIPETFRTWSGLTHTIVVFMALPLSAAQLLLPKGTRRHRRLGLVWGVALIAASLVSFGMHIITGGLSPPHYFSMATFVIVPLIAYLGYTRRRAAHRIVVLAYVLFFLVFAGAMTFKGERALASLFWSIWN
jgi:uncharacterized membrane protein